MTESPDVGPRSSKPSGSCSTLIEHQTSIKDDGKTASRPDKDLSVEAVNIEDLQFSISSKDYFHNWLNRRATCDGCGCSRKYYCYICRKALQPDSQPSSESLPITMTSSIKPPRVASLPVQVHIVRHPKEKPSKSSAIPLSILAPNSVALYDYPLLPSPEVFSQECVVLYPGEDATDAVEMDWRPVSDIVLIDCCWSQAATILRDPFFRSMRRVSLSTRRTVFWRHHTHSMSYLSTVETLYYIMRDISAASLLIQKAAFKNGTTISNDTNSSSDKDEVSNELTDHQYDDLLFFFAAQRDAVRPGAPVRARQRRERARELNEDSNKRRKGLTA